MKRLLLLLCLWLAPAYAVTVSITHGSGNKYTDASGRNVTGTIDISWKSFATGTGTNVAAGSTQVTIVTAGEFTVSLVANDTADPPVFYTVTFNSARSTFTQQWVVPSVAGPLTVNDVVRSSLSPVTILPSQISKVGATAGDIIYYHPTTGWTKLARGTVNGQALTVDTSLAGYLKWATISGTGVWGSITGTLSAQTDLAAALAAKIGLASLSATSPIVYNNSTGAITHAASAATIIDCGDTTHSCRLSFDAQGHVSAIANDAITTSGTGDVVGPSSATNNAIAIFDLATGKLIKNSLVTIDSFGNIVTPGNISAGDGTVAGGPKMYEIAANGTNFRQWLVPDLLTADLTMKFADAVPTAGQVMRFGAPSTSVSDVTWGNASGVGACGANTWASTLNNNAAPTCTQPAFSDVSGTASTAQIAANAVTSAKMAVVNTRRTACIPIGANNASAVIADADLGPQSRQYLINAAQTLVEVTVAADAGTPNIILGRSRAGTIVNLTSSALATASSGGIACSKGTAVTGLDGATTCSATLQNTALNAGDWITLVSGTAGGTAKEMTACFTTTVD